MKIFSWTLTSDNLQSLDLSLSPDIYLNWEEKVRASVIFQKGGKLKKKKKPKTKYYSQKENLFF